MGVGGLLMEIVTRPQPREKALPEKGKQVADVVLAAGRSTRMGAVNKMIAEIGGKPLVRIAAEQALASKASSVIVVTGHQRDRIEAALKGLNVRFANNPDYAEGLGTSLRAGIAAVPPEADGAVILLGDMPHIDAKLIDRLIAAFDPEKGALVVVPTIEGRRGNPVIWARRFFPELMAVTGDVGARHIVARVAEAVAEVAVTDPAITVDVDTPEVLTKISEKVR
jgi:molybdenum cofactor cytidylyltransferase